MTFFGFSAVTDGGVGGQQHPPRPRLTPLWQRADERFFWNKNLLGPLVGDSPVLNGWMDGRKPFIRLRPSFT